MTPLVVRIEDLQTGARSQFAFIKSPVRIGRSEINDLPLAQGFVSQWHAVVQFDDDEIRYVDLGSTNGSIVAGERIGKNVVVGLAPGTDVTIGALRLTFERRITGEHRAAPPRTQFAIRAATVMRGRPGTLPGTGVPAPPPAPPSPAGAPSPVELPAGAGAPPPVELPSVGAGAATLAAIARALATPLGEPMPELALPAPIPPSAPSAEAAPADVDRALEGAALDLDLLYASYRGSWEHLRAKLDETLAGLDPAARAAAGRRLAEKYPAALQEPQFRALSGAPGTGPFAPVAASLPGAPLAAPPARAGAAAGETSDAEQLLNAFAESYLPASIHVRTAAQRQAFLDRLAEIVEAFARAFVEMRKGYDEFGKQMGLRTVHGEGPVQRARDPRQLLAALLDPGQRGRTEELQAAFADYMVHQVAILNGVAEGAKAMLATLSPETIEASTQGLWPMKGQALWRAFAERFHALVDEEDAISEALFGREFGRAYSAILGQRGDQP